MTPLEPKYLEPKLDQENHLRQQQQPHLLEQLEFPNHCWNRHLTLWIKEKKRLIEKIDEENRQLEAGVTPITQKNFQERIDDLLGIRFICLRLSDIDRVKAYLELLADEKILRFIRKPDHKRSFVLPVDPGETIPEECAGR